MSNFHKIDEVIVTEEIYLKNIAKIKKYTNLPLAIDSDNLPWFAEDIEKLNAFISLLQPYGIKKISRTGLTAISRGSK